MRRLLLLVWVIAFAAAAWAQTKRIKPRAEPTVIKCKLLINPATGATIADGAIQIANGKIMKVGRATDFAGLDGYKVLDYSDKYVIPGLIDTHAHMYGGVQFRITTNENGPVL